MPTQRVVGLAADVGERQTSALQRWRRGARVSPSARPPVLGCPQKEGAPAQSSAVQRELVGEPTQSGSSLSSVSVLPLLPLPPRPVWPRVWRSRRAMCGLLVAIGPLSTVARSETPIDRRAAPVTRDLLRLALAHPGDALSPGWRLAPVRGQRPPQSIVVDSGPVRYLRLSGQARAAFLGYTLTPPISEIDGELHWRWRVVRAPDGADLRAPSTDDAALRVFVVFRRARWLSRTPRTLFYTLGGAEPPAYERPSFTSPDLFVLRAGAARDARDWVDVVVDPRADYARVWGEAAPPIEGVGLMQDTDQTHSAAVADVQSLSWRSRP